MSAEDSDSEVENRRRQSQSQSSDPGSDDEVERGKSADSSPKRQEEDESQEENDAPSANATAAAIFGSDVSSEDEDSGGKEDGNQSAGSSSPPARRRAADEDDEDEDAERVRDAHSEMRQQSYAQDIEDMADGEEADEVPEIRTEADIPRMVADLGSELYFVKFPNFLSVDTHPYNPDWYEDEIDEDELQDEEGKGRLKLKVENTIRWRAVLNPRTLEETKESNARVVKWSDGSTSLHLGSEIFDIHKTQMNQGENNHLFVRQGLGLHGQAVFKTKLSFRPHSTDSFTHRKMTLSLADKSQKTHKIRVLPNVGKDPEAHRTEMIKKEEDRLKASIRRENKARRTRERSHHRGPSASYLEPDQYDEEDEDGGISLSAIKNNAKKRDYSNTYSDSDDGSDLEIGTKKSSEKRKAARIEESDED